MNTNTRQVIALVSDLDDTLIDDTSTQLVESRGIPAAKFWGETVRALVVNGWDPSLAYLAKVVELSGEGNPMGRLGLAELKAFGATLDSKFYPGVDGLRAGLQEVVSAISPNIDVEFYVISGGIRAVMEGSDVLRRNCNYVYGNEFEEDAKTGCISRLKRAVTFTEKTRILFEINKGITAAQASVNPYLVNKDLDPTKRRVPFSNMIYMGDGLTDIASFSLVKARGGFTFGVFNPAKAASAQRALKEFIEGDRVTAAHAPRYGKDDELGSMLRATVASIAQRIIGGSSGPDRLLPTD